MQGSLTERPNVDTYATDRYLGWRSQDNLESVTGKLALYRE